MARSWTSVLVGEGALMGLEASQCALGRVEAAWRAISLFDREIYYVNPEKIAMLRAIQRPVPRTNGISCTPHIVISLVRNISAGEYERRRRLQKAENDRAAA